jgi:NitT/TauT family transport system ATP-binding protein
LLLDEPFSALDLEARLRLQERIKKYTVENQAITVLVTHDLQEAVSMADCLVLLSARPAHVRTVWKPAFSSMESTALQHDAGFKQFVETVATEIISTHA